MAWPFRSTNAPVLPLFQADTPPGRAAASRTPSQASSSDSTAVASVPGSLAPSSTLTLATPQTAAVKAGAAAPGHAEALLVLATQGAGASHQLSRLATVGWRSLLTASASFVHGSTRQGAMHMVGHASAVLAMPWLLPRGTADGTDERHPLGKPGRKQKLLFGLVALGAMLDPAGQAGALLAGAGGLGLAATIPQNSRFGRLVAGALPGVLMEAGRAALPIGTHALTRHLQIGALDAQAAALSGVEDLDRPWTELAFVGGHLSHDRGLTPFSSMSPVPAPFRWLGMFASHQSLSIAQQFEHGYTAFSFEFIEDGLGALRSTHSTWWDYGSLVDVLKDVNQGLIAHPDALVVMKLSPQQFKWDNWGVMSAAFVESGLADKYLTDSQIGPHRGKKELLRSGLRLIVTLDSSLQTSWNAETTQQLKTHKFLGDWSQNPWTYNMFTTWGFEPWSEQVNLAAPTLLQAMHQKAGQNGGALNIVLANDLATSGLIAFKRAYNAPKT